MPCTCMQVLVGYSPRIISYDPYTGVPKYSRWQHTWWTGQYDIILTKASFLHAEYLYEYEKLMSKETLDYIDQHRKFSIYLSIDLLVYLIG